MNTQDLFREILKTLQELRECVRATKVSTEKIENDISQMTLSVDKLVITGVEIKIGSSNK